MIMQIKNKKIEKLVNKSKTKNPRFLMNCIKGGSTKPHKACLNAEIHADYLN